MVGAVEAGDVGRRTGWRSRSRDEGELFRTSKGVAPPTGTPRAFIVPSSTLYGDDEMAADAQEFVAKIALRAPRRLRRPRMARA